MLDMDGEAPPTQIDLILMDILMPELDGVEACRQIKSRLHLCDIPIIMVTANNDRSNLQAAFAAGANDYITKPVTQPGTLGTGLLRACAEERNGLPQSARRRTSSKQ